MVKQQFLATAFKLFSRRERWVFSILFFLGLFGLVGLASIFNAKALIEVPASGGSLSEGLIGSPRFINPLLATSDTDKDLSYLVYSGLMRITPNNELIPDLAENYEISSSGLEYTFTLKNNLVWQDGKPITADDVVFTIEQVKNQTIKSPRFPNWEGITAKKIDAKTVKFTLRQAYGGFLENTTLGLLPQHLWQAVEPEAFPFSPLNVEPIGSGPYQIAATHKNNQKIAEAYELIPFAQFALGRAKITNLIIKFYPNEEARLEAYRKGEIEVLAALDPNTAKTLTQEPGITLKRTTLPRIFAVFFNQNHAKVLADQATRRALDQAINKSKLVDIVLGGFGLAVDNPLGLAASSTTNLKTLAKPIEFSLATADTPELKQAAEFLQKTWSEIGASVTLDIFEAGDLNQNVIRPREYDALLFGEVIGRRAELYPFWHSSQRLDPGLNIALYTNSSVDKLLESAREENDPEKHLSDQTKANQTIKTDQPASFLYRPDFLYLLPQNVHGVNLPTLNSNAERFANIYEWYRNTDQVWPIFKNLVR